MTPSVLLRRLGRRRVAIAVITMAAAAATGCGGGSDSAASDATADTQLTAEAVPGTAAVPMTVLAIGDSQTAGAWLDDPANESWPAQLDDLLCPTATCVTNMSVGGQPIGTESPSGQRPLLETLDAQLEAAGSTAGADTAVIMIGQLDLVSNDDTEQILGWYGDLEERLASFGIDDVHFMTLLPFDTEAHPNPEWIPQLEIRRAAINDGLRTRWGAVGHLIELDDVLTEPGSAEFLPELSIKDGNHLSVEGSRIVAAEVETHLRASFGLDG